MREWLDESARRRNERMTACLARAAARATK
jgi:hypothetical protein